MSVVGERGFEDEVVADPSSCDLFSKGGQEPSAPPPSSLSFSHLTLPLSSANLRVAQMKRTRPRASRRSSAFAMSKGTLIPSFSETSEQAVIESCVDCYWWVCDHVAYRPRRRRDGEKEPVVVSDTPNRLCVDVRPVADGAILCVCRREVPRLVEAVSCDSVDSVGAKDPCPSPDPRLSERGS